MDSIFISDFPYVRGTPSLSTQYNETSKEFLFSCQVNVPERQDVFYLIEWLHNSVPISKSNITVDVNTTLNIIDIPQLALGSNVSFCCWLNYKMQ